MSNVLEEVVDLTTLNIMRSTRAMLMKFCIVSTPRCQVLIWVCKVFYLFRQNFACEKVKGNIMKRQKTSGLKHFSLPRYSKNGLHNENMFPPQFTTSLKVTWKTITFLKFWLAMYKFTFTFTFTLLYMTVHFLSCLNFLNLIYLYLLRKGAHKTYLFFRPERCT